MFTLVKKVKKMFSLPNGILTVKQIEMISNKKPYVNIIVHYLTDLFYKKNQPM